MFSVTNNVAKFQCVEFNLQIYLSKREGLKGLYVFHSDTATLPLLQAAPVSSLFPQAAVQSKLCGYKLCGLKQ